MSRTAKNPITLARAALKLGQQALDDYSHPKSPQKFTQPQLFAMLVLKQFFKLDYRGIVEWLANWSELRQALELKGIPAHSTLFEASKRLLKKGAHNGCWMQRFSWPARRLGPHNRGISCTNRRNGPRRQTRSVPHWNLVLRG